MFAFFFTCTRERLRTPVRSEETCQRAAAANRDGGAFAVFGEGEEKKFVFGEPELCKPLNGWKKESAPNRFPGERTILKLLLTNSTHETDLSRETTEREEEAWPLLQ